MQDATKKEIQLLAIDYVKGHDSQAKAVALLKNISEASFINIVKGNWGNISDDMFRNLGKQIGWSNTAAWHLAQTQDFDTLITFFADAKDYGNVYGIVGPSGSGKTSTANFFSKNKRNVYHITCAQYFNRKVFLTKLLEKMGIENMGYNVSEMMDMIIEVLIKQDKPVIILDEFDKVSEEVLYFFISLYNMLQGKCGIIIMATDFLSKRIMKGVKKNAKGYNEIYSRIGRRFIPLNGVNDKEVKEICELNGVTNTADHIKVWNECEKDLRRVERALHKIKIRQEPKKAA